MTDGWPQEESNLVMLGGSTAMTCSCGCHSAWQKLTNQPAACHPSAGAPANSSYQEDHNTQQRIRGNQRASSLHDALPILIIVFFPLGCRALLSPTGGYTYSCGTHRSQSIPDSGAQLPSLQSSGFGLSGLRQSLMRIKTLPEQPALDESSAVTSLSSTPFKL